MDGSTQRAACHYARARARLWLGGCAMPTPTGIGGCDGWQRMGLWLSLARAGRWARGRVIGVVRGLDRAVGSGGFGRSPRVALRNPFIIWRRIYGGTPTRGVGTPWGVAGGWHPVHQSMTEWHGYCMTAKRDGILTPGRQDDRRGPRMTDASDRMGGSDFFCMTGKL